MPMTEKSELLTLQNRLEDLKQATKKNGKLHKKIEELENNLAVGVIDTKKAADLLAQLMAETNLEQSGVKDSLKNNSPLMPPKRQMCNQPINRIPTKSGVLSTSAMISRFDSMLSEQLMQPINGNIDKLRVLVLAYTDFTLRENAKIKAENCALQGVLAEEAEYYGEMIEMLRTGKEDVRVLLKEALKILKYLSTGTGKTIEFQVDSGDNEEICGRILASFCQKYKEDNQVAWPMIIELLLK